MLADGGELNPREENALFRALEQRGAFATNLLPSETRESESNLAIWGWLRECGYVYDPDFDHWMNQTDGNISMELDKA